MPTHQSLTVVRILVLARLVTAFKESTYSFVKPSEKSGLEYSTAGGMTSLYRRLENAGLEASTQRISARPGGRQKPWPIGPNPHPPTSASMSFRQP